MKPRFLLVLCAVLFSLNATAQDSGRIDVFGGYSHLFYYIYPAYTGPWTQVGWNGFEASASYRLIPHLSAEADFDFQFPSSSSSSGQKIQTFMGGPRVTLGAHKLNFFAHVLIGALRNSGTYESNTTSAQAFGGGFDFWLSRHLGIRPIQLDYLRTSFNEGSYFAVNGNHANCRLSAGVTLRF
jgi:outer membrane immunogenic protein